MTVIDCQIFSWKVFFGQNFLVEKKNSKSTPNDPKGEKKRSPVKFGPPDGPDRPVGKTGDRFFHVLDHLEL